MNNSQLCFLCRSDMQVNKQQNCSPLFRETTKIACINIEEDLTLAIEMRLTQIKLLALVDSQRSFVYRTNEPLQNNCIFSFKAFLRDKLKKIIICAVHKGGAAPILKMIDLYL